MLQPASYPENYPPLKKLQVLEKQAKILGQAHNFYRVPQTTFFHDGLNSAGVEMKASTGSGQDCTGVNDGSKNSVLVTYLADAWNWGAEMFCECEIKYVLQDQSGKGYIVFFAWHGEGREAFGEEGAERLMWVRAVSTVSRRVFVARPLVHKSAQGKTDDSTDTTLHSRCRSFGYYRNPATLSEARPCNLRVPRSKGVWERRHSQLRLQH